MIKVLEIIPGYNFGGIESVFQYSVTKIQSKEIQIDLLVEEIANYKKIAKLKEQGINVHTIPRLKYTNLFTYIRKVNGILSNENYDVIHSYNITRSPIFFIVAKTRKIKHRIFHARTNKIDGNIIKKIFLRINIYIATLLATKLLANSRKAGEFFFNKKQFEILNNGLDIEKFKFNIDKRNEIRLKLKLGDELVIGHMGRFTEAKNHLFLIEIFNEFIKKQPNTKLLLVGDGPLQENIMKKIKQMNLENKVIFTGPVENPQDYFQSMDYFLFPSKYEGFGNVVIEAQASGLEILAADTLPMATQVTDLINYYSIECTPMEWSENIKLKKQIQRENYYKKVLKSGYDISEVLQIKEDLYRKLCTTEENASSNLEYK
ncbi:glycosyltransferase family 1 protein [Ruoffia tabacinasalis]|uniref:Glycosyltransferase family 1 protein n=1 Tax=Ruoffia tabacinasalis TaxID=87458 RepID=A0A5R9DSV2_9LACT|nr:glycosyltransferase [Ruoffia tabacinasalis]TLQ39886.1 glycosyltransferase family 1 protein [Ruoffia tabacinasalis]